MSHFNVVIVGGGPGGYEAAIRCSQLKMSTALIEKDKMGGTCLNRGCIPTKAFVHSAGFLKELKISRKLGIDAGEPDINIGKLVLNKNKIVRGLVSGVDYLMRKNNITVYNAEARFIDNHSIMAGGEQITFDYLIIATGSSCSIPPVPGMDLEGIMTSTEILDIDHIPSSLTIIGGGVIGCELACVFREFGSEVTVVDMLDHILPGIDRDISDVLAYSMSCEGVRFILESTVNAVEKTADGFAVKIIKDGKTEVLRSEDVLVAAGRKGNSSGLEPLGLETEHGYIKTDAHMKTNVPNIFAIGDVTGGIQLAHVASAEGVAAAVNICGGDVTIDYNAIPNSIFTVPEIAVCGMSEERAKAEGIDYVAGRFPMRASGRAMTLYETDGFIKLIAERTSGKVIGAGVIGANATEIIGELAYVIRSGGTLEDIENTVHAHPTISETIHEAALAALGRPMSI